MVLIVLVGALGLCAGIMIGKWLIRWHEDDGDEYTDDELEMIGEYRVHVINVAVNFIINYFHLDPEEMKDNVQIFMPRPEYNVINILANNKIKYVLRINWVAEVWKLTGFAILEDKVVKHTTRGTLKDDESMELGVVNKFLDKHLYKIWKAAGKPDGVSPDIPMDEEVDIDEEA